MTREFRADIQALRGYAVLLVVFYHASFDLLSAGYLGVDIFFVISGYLITGLIKTQLEQGRFCFWDFYYRRAKRLLPAAYVVIALTTIAAPYFLSNLGLEEFRYQVFGALTFAGNIALWLQSDYFAGTAETKPLLHVWSLAVEEQYYLLLPAFLFLLSKRLWLAGISLLLIISFALCLYVTTQDPSAAFYLLPTRFWEMAIGSVGALLPANYLLDTKLSLLRLPALTALFVIPVSPVGGSHPGVDAFLVCMATLILLLTQTKENLVVRGAAWIGDISYSLYLIHWPVLVYLRAAWLVDPPEFVIWGALGFSVATSWALHQFVEEPFRRGFFVSRIRLVSGLMATSLLLGLVPSILTAATEKTKNFNRIRRTNVGLARVCAFKAGSPPHEIPKNCQTTDKPKILVWGDSYAMALAPGLAKSIGEKGVAQLTMSACGPAIGMAPFSDSSTSPYQRAFAEDCIRFNDSVLAVIKNRPEIEVVALSSPFTAPVSPNGQMLVRRGDATEVHSTSQVWAIAGIKALVDEVRAIGKRIVVVAPPPSSGIDIGDCLERKAKGQIILGMYRDCEIPVSEHVKYRSRTLKMLEQLPFEAEVEVVSVYDFLCDQRACKTNINGKFIYRDYGHLSYEGSEILVKQSGLGQILLDAAR